jgi:hypothetical protein
MWRQDLPARRAGVALDLGCGHTGVEVDRSSLVNTGRQQPKAKIQALANRAAKHLSEADRRGEI